MKKTIVHQVSLSNLIGGVQYSFFNYFKEAIKSSAFTHEIFGMHELDNNSFDIDASYYKNIKSSVFIFLQFCFRLCSAHYIIHFYNNLGSKKLYYLLKCLPVNNIIFHERGTSWNLNENKAYIIKSNLKKAKVVIVNSEASKIILLEKFKIISTNIEVIYNGILPLTKITNKKEVQKNDNFKIGFLGRLDTHKGVHTFIDLAKRMNNCDFLIGGSGALEKNLKEYGDDLPNLRFLGRVISFEFLSKIDLLIVPSIREPLGNVIIEAGFLKCPVIASNVDGIPEIISHNENGILITPKLPPRKMDLPNDAVDYPQYVVDGNSRKLTSPKEIDVEELQSSVDFLKLNKKKRYELGNNLFTTVKDKFTLATYFQKLELLYKSI